MQETDDVATDDAVLLKSGASCLNRVYYVMLLLPVPLYIIFVFAFSGSTNPWSMILPQPAWQIPLSLAAIFFVHELLHVVIFLLGGVSAGNMRMSFDRTSLSLSLSLHQKITVRLWKMSLLAPFAVLNPSIALIGFFSGPESSAWLLLAFSVSGCSFDLAVYSGLRGVADSTLVYPALHSRNGRVSLKT